MASMANCRGLVQLFILVVFIQVSCSESDTATVHISDIDGEGDGDQVEVQFKSLEPHETLLRRGSDVSSESSAPAWYKSTAWFFKRQIESEPTIENKLQLRERRAPTTDDNTIVSGEDDHDDGNSDKEQKPETRTTDEIIIEEELESKPRLPKTQVNVDAAPFALGEEGEDRDPSKFYVISPVFNPASFKKRPELYRAFAAHMNETDAQLITIEAIFPSLGQTEFQVTSPDNPNHIQIKAESVYWVKESLINYAVRKLPPNAKYIAWIDGDLVFQNTGWIANTIDQLHQYLVVQCFDNANFLGPDGVVLRSDRSFGFTAVAGKGSNWYAHPGYAWATTRRTFEAMGGLPDYDIMGSNDLHFAFALVNGTSSAVVQGLAANPPFQQFIANKATQLYSKLIDLATSSPRQMDIVGYVPGTINHAWHGSWRDRQYVQRWNILNEHQFNFTADMERRDEDGLLTFANNNAKDLGLATPEEDTNTMTTVAEVAAENSLQKDIITYFQQRNEDSNVPETPAEQEQMELQLFENVEKASTTARSKRAVWWLAGREEEGQLEQEGVEGRSYNKYNNYKYMTPAAGTTYTYSYSYGYGFSRLYSSYGYNYGYGYGYSYGRRGGYGYGDQGRDYPNNYRKEGGGGYGKYGSKGYGGYNNYNNYTIYNQTYDGNLVYIPYSNQTYSNYSYPNQTYNREAGGYNDNEYGGEGYYNSYEDQQEQYDKYEDDYSPEVPAYGEHGGKHYKQNKYGGRHPRPLHGPHRYAHPGRQYGQRPMIGPLPYWVAPAPGYESRELTGYERFGGGMMRTPPLHSGPPPVRQSPQPYDPEYEYESMEQQPQQYGGYEPYGIRRQRKVTETTTTKDLVGENENGDSVEPDDDEGGAAVVEEVRKEEEEEILFPAGAVGLGLTSFTSTEED